MSLIHAYKGRGITRLLTALDAAGSPILPGGNDKIRIVIGRVGETAKLTVSSDAATANGSTFTKNASTGVNTLRLDASDLDFDAGIYSLEFLFFDGDDASEWKTVDVQVFNLEGRDSVA